MGIRNTERIDPFKDGKDQIVSFVKDNPSASIQQIGEFVESKDLILDPESSIMYEVLSLCARGRLQQDLSTGKFSLGTGEVDHELAKDLYFSRLRMDEDRG